LQTEIDDQVGTILRAAPAVLSMCDPGNQNLMKKIQNMLVWVNKMVLALHFCTLCSGWQKAQQNLTPAREECNKYDLTDCCSLFLIDQS
jgi:hypothetical protein